VARRTSAEVVNATLLEVFLTFVFVVLSVAVFQQNRASAEKERADRLRESAGSLRQRLEDSLAIARDSVDSLIAKFVSPFPPPCVQDSSPDEFAIFTLTSVNRFDVLILRTEQGFMAGRRLRVMWPEMRRTFLRIWNWSRAHDCRFKVRVQDTDGVSKADYKRGLAVVKSMFYTSGEFR
jgi:hypothetical protein